MNKLLIIGGSGLFGKSFIDCGARKKLIKHRINKIYIISRKKKKIKKTKYNYLEINYISKNFLKVKRIPKVDFIIYCLRDNSIKNSCAYFQNLQRIILKQKKKPKILYTSSGAIYGENNKKIKFKEITKLDLKKINRLKGYKKKYALEKIYIENKFRQLGQSNIKVSIARCFNFVGKYIINSDQAIGDMLSNIQNKKIIKLKTKINVFRAYMNTDDLVNWLITILKKSNKDCPIYNVGSDKEINLFSLGKKISKIFNKKFSFKPINNKKIDYYVPSINKAKKLLKLKIQINLNDSLNSFIK